MIGLRPAHIVIIVLVALILFAPSRLPMLARGMKTMVSEFKQAATDKSDKDSSASKTPPG